MDPGQTTPSRLRRRMGPIFVLGAVAVAAAIAVSEGQLAADQRGPQAAPALEHDVPSLADGQLRFSEQFVRSAGIVFEPVRTKTVVPTVEATGTVEFDRTHMAIVGTRIFGRVGDVRVTPGQVVKAGDVLAELESAELGQAEADLAALRAEVSLAKAEANRKGLLVDEGIAPRKSLQIARQRLQSSQARLRAAEQRVQVLGGHARRRQLGSFTLRAPIAGEVVAMDVVRGESIAPGHDAFHIADLSSLWIELDVFEGDLAGLSVGDPVTLVHAGSGSAQTHQAKIARIGTVLDPDTRTAPIRIEIDNADRALKIGQSVVARISANKAAVEGIAIPRDAFVLVDGQPTVFVEVARNTVEPRVIEVGVEGDALVEVRSGLEPGERVVVDGVFELKSEFFR